MSTPSRCNVRGATRQARVAAISAVFLLLTARAACPQGSKADYERALSLDQRTANRVFRDHVKAHWLPGGARFWYRVQTGPQQREVVLVDAEKGTRTLASDAARQGPGPGAAAALAGRFACAAAAHTGEATTIAFCNRSAVEVELFWLAFDGRRRSYGKIAPGGRRQMSTYEGHVWLVLNAQGRELALVEARDEPGRVEITAAPLPPRRTIGGAARRSSPDGKWLATIENHNVWLRHAALGASSP